LSVMFIPTMERMHQAEKGKAEVYSVRIFAFTHGFCVVGYCLCGTVMSLALVMSNQIAMTKLVMKALYIPFRTNTCDTHRNVAHKTLNTSISFTHPSQSS
jgi:hypothetical protein